MCMDWEVSNLYIKETLFHRSLWQIESFEIALLPPPLRKTEICTLVFLWFLYTTCWYPVDDMMLELPWWSILILTRTLWMPAVFYSPGVSCFLSFGFLSVRVPVAMTGRVTIPFSVSVPVVGISSPLKGVLGHFAWQKILLTLSFPSCWWNLLPSRAKCFMIPEADRCLNALRWALRKQVISTLRWPLSDSGMHLK